MEPDRFDDVEFRVLESPEPLPQPSRPRRRHRWAVALTLTAFTAGALAAGASAFTDSAQAPATKKAAVKAHGYSAGDCPFKHRFDDAARY
jgi:ferric-dicitrate binding protein FerR (iron transport regulator)